MTLAETFDRKGENFQSPLLHGDDDNACLL